MLELLLIGVAISVDPIPLAAYMVILQSKRGVVKGAAFLVGWLISLAAVVGITALATGGEPPRSQTAPSLAGLAVKMAIGVALLVIGLRHKNRAGRPRAAKRPPRWQAGVDDMSPWYAMGIGPLVQPWGLIAAGCTIIINAKLSGAGSFFALFGFCLLASASYIALELYACFRPAVMQRVIEGTRGWVAAHGDQVIVVGSLILGLWLIADSIYLILK